MCTCLSCLPDWYSTYLLLSSLVAERKRGRESKRKKGTARAASEKKAKKSKKQKKRTHRSLPATVYHSFWVARLAAWLGLLWVCLLAGAPVSFFGVILLNTRFYAKREPPPPKIYKQQAEALREAGKENSQAKKKKVLYIARGPASLLWFFILIHFYVIVGQEGF